MIPRDYLPALRAAEQVMIPIDPGHAAVLAQIARLIADNRVVILQPKDPDDEGGVDR